MQAKFKHFLITGASGFIGHNLSVYLKKLNCKVTAIIKNHPHDNPNNAYKYQKLWDQIIIHNFNQQNSLNNLAKQLQQLPDQNFDAIIHLANIAHTNDNISLQDYWNTNVLSSLNLLDLALITKAKSMIYLSSIKAVLEPTTNTCLNEKFNSWPNHQDFYGITKRMAEELLLQKLQSSNYKNISLTILRPSLVYGPKVKGYLKLLIETAKKYYLPNLTETPNKRSMIHIDDLINAIIIASQHPAANRQTFIVSDNYGYSTKQIFNHINQQTTKQHNWLFIFLTKIPIPYLLLVVLAKLIDCLQILLPNKIASKLLFNSTILHKLFGSSYFSSEKIQSQLNWQPKYTFFDSKF